MLKLSKILNDNQSLSDQINDIFYAQADGTLLFKDKKSFYDSLRAPKKIKDRIVNSIEELDASLIEENPYIKGLRNHSFKLNDWQLKTILLKANSLFVKEETYADQDLNEVTKLAYFCKNIEVPALFEGDRIWMSVVPHEIFTMSNSLNQCKGRVLVYGLGLGYFPLMAAMKNDVKEVIIVEKEEEPIDIFSNFIAPNFKEAKKIRIIKEDAFVHASKIKDDEFDTIFIDIWHDAEDGISAYSSFLKIFSEFKSTEVFYWIEETILTYAKRIIEILLIEREEGLTEKDYQKAKTIDDSLINDIYKAAKPYLDEKEILSSSMVKAILRRIR